MNNTTDPIANLDERRFARVPFDAQVTLTFAEQTFTGVLADISFNGLLVTLQSPLKIDPTRLASYPQGHAQVQLSASDVCFELDVVIKHLIDTKAGLQIKQMPIETAEHLRNLMQQNLGDEQLLTRELSLLVGQA